MTATDGGGSSAAQGTSTTRPHPAGCVFAGDSGFHPQLPPDLRQGQRAPGCVVRAPLLDRADRLVAQLLVSTVRLDRSLPRRPSVARTAIYGRNLFRLGHRRLPPASAARTRIKRIFRILARVWSMRFPSGRHTTSTASRDLRTRRYAVCRLVGTAVGDRGRRPNRP